MKILVTGAAGFIGYHVSKKLIERGDEVVGIDNLNTYYDKTLKEDRLKNLKSQNFSFKKTDLLKDSVLKNIFTKEGFDGVIHLAAQAGVRYSLENPKAYIDSNVLGFYNILNCCKDFEIDHLVYASSSSVYGNNDKVPFEEIDNVDHPVSLYAATKKTNELFAYNYSHLFKIPITGLRFFTVYGPWGRPDMAYFKFTKSLLEENPIDVFNSGNLMRDFTYIDDIVEGVLNSFDKPPPYKNNSAHRILNIGNNKPVQLLKFIQIIENIVGKKAIMRFVEMQDGDVMQTYANIDEIEKLTGFKPKVDLETGLKEFILWYKSYYRL